MHSLFVLGTGQSLILSLRLVSVCRINEHMSKYVVYFYEKVIPPTKEPCNTYSLTVVRVLQQQDQWLPMHRASSLLGAFLEGRRACGVPCRHDGVCE